MEKLEHCPVCDKNNLIHFLECKDMVAVGGNFSIVKCTSCSFLFTNPRPGVSEIGPYYKSDRYISHSSNKSGIIYRLYDLVRNISITSKLNLIKKYHTSGTLLDLGCGLGYFLHGVKKDGVFEATGADISEDAIEYVKSKFGYNILSESTLEQVEEQSFDIITQWHVLEHVHLLDERMKQLHKMLKTDGTMFIAVPNSASWDAGYYKSHWDGFDVPRHLYHFNRKSFSMLMNKYGFKVVDIKPMWFDAPYISMRSESHKGSGLPFLFGAIFGLYSNFKATISGDYSSLMFIVKKS